MRRDRNKFGSSVALIFFNKEYEDTQTKSPSKVLNIRNHKRFDVKAF